MFRILSKILFSSSARASSVVCPPEPENSPDPPPEPPPDPTPEPPPEPPPEPLPVFPPEPWLCPWLPLPPPEPPPDPEFVPLIFFVEFLSFRFPRKKLKLSIKLFLTKSGKFLGGQALLLLGIRKRKIFGQNFLKRRLPGKPNIS